MSEIYEPDGAPATGAFADGRGENPNSADARRVAFGRLLRPLVLRALDNWHVGRLTIHLPEGTTVVAGRADAKPQATVRIVSDRFFGDFALKGDLGAGESYMDGAWSADNLPRLLELVLLNQGAVGGDSWLSGLLNLPNDVRHRLRRNTRRGSRRNIGAHYDLSNELFALFLDPSMTYSSAVFASPDEPLESAQKRKFERLADRLELQPGQHVLEIGCGWGAFAMHLARRYDVRVTGITVSREQLELATQRVKEAGLDRQIDIRLCDYRDVTGRYDAIVSVEMLEAVGREHWPTFFERCHAVLAPGGQVGIQTITMPDHRFEQYAAHCDWIQKYIFPGGLLPSIGQMIQAMGAHTPFVMRHLEDIGPHYAETLARWRSAFFANLAEVRRLGFDQRFVRMWDFYLASCEASFRTRVLGNHQFVLARAGGSDSAG